MLENTLSLGRNAAVRKLAEIREIRVINALWDTFSLGFRRSSTKFGKIEKCFFSLHVNVY